MKKNLAYYKELAVMLRCIYEKSLTAKGKENLKVSIRSTARRIKEIEKKVLCKPF